MARDKLYIDVDPDATDDDLRALAEALYDALNDALGGDQAPPEPPRPS